MMDNRLNGLKENMDNTVLKNLDFREKNMDAVRKVIYKSQKTKSIKNMYPRILSLGFTCIFMLGISYFALENLGFIQNEKRLTSQSDKKELKSNNNDTINKSSQQASAKNDVTNNKDIVTIQNVHNNQLEEYSITPSQYVVFDGYFYRMVAEVEQSQLGSQIGEVKRIGEWEIIKDGDSNTVTGPIYSVINKSPEEVIATKLWSNRDVYVLFERKEIVEQPDITKIYSTKNDPEEVQIAIKNVREKSSVLYEFKDNERLELISVSFDPNNNSTVSLSYRVPEVDTTVQGLLSVMQYPKNKIPEASEFIKKVYKDENGNEWETPILKESFVVNGMEWDKYETFNKEVVYRGEQQSLYFEIMTQGEININLISELLISFKQSNN